MPRFFVRLPRSRSRVISLSMRCLVWLWESVEFGGQGYFRLGRFNKFRLRHCDPKYFPRREETIAIKEYSQGEV